jgi:hypothetical protein
MQLQLSMYLSNNIDACLNGFSGLKETGFDVNVLSGPVVETRIYGSGQDFLLNYEIEVYREGESQIISDYYVKSSLPLKRLYDIAYNITTYEVYTNHLDDFTRTLIFSRAGPSENLLPPKIYHVSDKSNIMWYTPVVNQKITRLIDTYSQVFQVMGSKNFDDSFIEKIPDNLSTEKMTYVQGVLPIYNSESSTIENISINLNYFDHPLYVDVSPSSGFKIGPKNYPEKGSEVSMGLPDDSNTYYRFYYDISYPLIGEIRNYDENNRNNELNFMFALEVNVIKNNIYNELLLGYGPIPWDIDLIGFSYDPEVQLEEDLVSKIFSGVNNIFCEPSQRLSSNITVMVYDRVSNDALDDTYVSFGCGTYAECYLGSTFDKNGAGYFSDNAPLCNNGYLLLEKEGYQSKRIKLTTEKDKPINLGAVGLYPLQKKNISIKMFNISYDIKTNNGKSKIDGVKINNESNFMFENDSAIITLKLVQDSLEPELQVYFTLNSQNSKEVNLIPGRYSIEIFYLDNDGVVIPKNCDKECEDCGLLEFCVNGVKNCKRYPNEDINITPAPWGGLEFDENHPISFRHRDIYGNNSLELYIFRYPEPTALSCLDSLEEMGKKAEYTLKYRSKLVPKFS